MNLLFDDLINQLLCEFNVEDRNDPAFYDYAVLLVKQLLQRNLLRPVTDVRKAAMQIVKDGYYNFIDDDGNVALKVEFIFGTEDRSPNNLSVQIKEIPSEKVVKQIDNTHEESSIEDIAEFIEEKDQEQKSAGKTAPEEVGETPSELPGAVEPQTQTPNTSQYLKGL